MKPGSDSRVGDWIQTVTGRQFWPLSAWPDEIVIEDVAHALANICRFGGHTRVFYSVAQHSVLVSQLVRQLAPTLALDALLHDATEAYLGDIVRPLKRGWPEYEHRERALHRVVAERFGIAAEIPGVVRIADDRVLVAEARDFMGAPSWARTYALNPWPEEPIVPWSPDLSRRWFLETYQYLAGQQEQQEEKVQ